jgi:hypothetical protein
MSSATRPSPDGHAAAKRPRAEAAAAAGGGPSAALAAAPPPPSFLEDLQDMVADMEAEEADSRKHWKRPDLAPINPATDRIVFQQLELDHYLDDPVAGMPSAWLEVGVLSD